jgi:superfamily II DNA or RNA helicase
MKTEAFNNEIVVSAYTSDEEREIISLLSYTDKSKEFQARKMENNRFIPRHLVEKVKQEAHGNLIAYKEDRSIVVPPGFIDQFKIDTDNRVDTGSTISLPWNVEPPKARPYQEEAVELMLNNKRGVINMGTGLGKTLTSVHFLRKFKRKALIVCPSSSIANGFYEELCKAFGKNRIGYMGGGKKKVGDITVGLAQTIVKNTDMLKDLGVVIFDETHHISASTFYSIANDLGYVGRMFGLTATAFRSDGKDIFIEASLGKVLIKLDAAWGIENGWLAFPHFIVRKVNTQGPNYPGDKLKNYKKHVLESKEMTDVICKDINWAVEKQQSVLVLVSEIEHGEILSKATGLPLATGENKESKNLIDSLNDGKIPGLIATSSLVGEGCDTRRVDVLILANFAGSAGPVTQNVGRGLRKYPGKEEVIIFDYMPNNQMLARHCNTRIKVFKTLSQEIRIL